MVTSPPAKMRTGFSQAGVGLTSKHIAAVMQHTKPRLPVSLVLKTNFLTKPDTAEKTSDTPTALQAMAQALSGEWGSLILSDTALDANPSAVIMIAPGRMNAKPETRPPTTPFFVTPIAKPTWVLDGPGRQFAIAKSS
ncbi:unnamed protein product [Prorocentrum cordatum]|uniref:Subtilisin n=1 Tax=Prorocentrum cordatum TaxID=2364126 RepID=A0ABN9TYK0_9DINO|nr:unnamed protein product [Polarella glacialis]